jgi:hypothetical protein
MILAAVITRSFAFESAKFTRMLRHWGAGILMGIGAAVAGGGNDSQLLLSLPALSLAGLLTIVSILLGIYVVKLAQSLRQRRN